MVLKWDRRTSIIIHLLRFRGTWTNFNINSKIFQKKHHHLHASLPPPDPLQFLCLLHFFRHLLWSLWLDVNGDGKLTLQEFRQGFEEPCRPFIEGSSCRQILSLPPAFKKKRFALCVFVCAVGLGQSRKSEKQQSLCCSCLVPWYGMLLTRHTSWSS